MTANSPSRTRALGLGAAALLLAGAAMAQATDTAANTAANTAVEATSSQIVVRDAATGALRAASALEAKALASERASAGIRLNTQPRAHFSGARGVRLSDEFMSHAVLARLPDGSVVEQCFHTPEEAAIAHKAMFAAKATNVLPTE